MRFWNEAFWDMAVKSTDLLAGVLAAILVTGTVGVRAQEPLSTTGVLLDRIVVVVNDGVVLQSEVERQTASIVARLRMEGMQMPPREVLVKQIVEKLIMDKIQLQRADRLGINVSDDQLNAALATVAQRNQISLSQLPEALAAQGISYADYREDIRNEMRIEQLRNRDLIPRIDISRKEVEDFLKRRGKNADSDYDISHILISVSPAASAEERAEAKKRADEIYERLRDGEDFAQLAIAYSNGQQALEGGRIGWRKAEQLPTLFADQVLAMKPGDVSEPIASGSGFHIVRLNELRGAEPVIVTQRHARHILISPNELRSDAEAKAIAADLRARIAAGEDFVALAKQHSDDKVSAVDGGDLDWANPGTFVPQFEAQLDRMQPGDVSEPVRTPFGWHIIELLGTREKDNSEEQSMQEAYIAIRGRKLQQETERWLLQLRDEAYVDYRI